MKRLSLLVALVPSLASAHFILEAPKNNFTQNILGDPQKAPPCGEEMGSSATGLVTTFVAGQTITITVNETIYHPGHYRVSLGLNGPQDLPAEPVVTAGSTACGSVPIESSPTFPVLADGQLVHTAAFNGKQSFQVTLPSDVTCTNCTLQVLEFMSNHPLNNPGGCFYHHCAVINVVAADGGVPDPQVNPPAMGCSCSDVAAAPFLAALLWLISRRSLTRGRSL